MDHLGVSLGRPEELAGVVEGGSEGGTSEARAVQAVMCQSPKTASPGQPRPAGSNRVSCPGFQGRSHLGCRGCRRGVPSPGLEALEPKETLRAWPTLTRLEPRPCAGPSHGLGSSSVCPLASVLSRGAEGLHGGSETPGPSLLLPRRLPQLQQSVRADRAAEGIGGQGG